MSETQSYPGALVRDIGGSFEDYLSRLTVKRRHNLRRKLRLSRESIDLVTQIVSVPDNSTIDAYAFSIAANRVFMSRLFMNLTTNIQHYQDWTAYLKDRQPKTLIV